MCQTNISTHCVNSWVKFYQCCVFQGVLPFLTATRGMKRDHHQHNPPPPADANSYLRMVLHTADMREMGFTFVDPAVMRLSRPSQTGKSSEDTPTMAHALPSSTLSSPSTLSSSSSPLSSPLPSSFSSPSVEGLKVVTGAQAIPPKTAHARSRDPSYKPGRFSSESSFVAWLNINNVTVCDLGAGTTAVVYENTHFPRPSTRCLEVHKSLALARAELANIQPHKHDRKALLGRGAHHRSSSSRSHFNLNLNLN